MYNYSDMSIDFFGGTADAERKKAKIIANEYYDIDYEITCLRANYNNKFDKIQHRDVLGAVHNMGINFNRIGDIVVLEREIYILKNKLSKTMYFSETCKEFYIKFLNSKKEKFKEVYNPNIIFTNNSNERLTDRSVRRLINKYGEMANLNKEISPYTLRHSFCIYMLKNGMPKEYLARLLDLKVVGLLDVYEGLC